MELIRAARSDIIVLDRHVPTAERSFRTKDQPPPSSRLALAHTCRQDQPLYVSWCAGPGRASSPRIPGFDVFHNLTIVVSSDLDVRAGMLVDVGPCSIAVDLLISFDPPRRIPTWTFRKLIKSRLVLVACTAVVTLNPPMNSVAREPSRGYPSVEISCSSACTSGDHSPVRRRYSSISCLNYRSVPRRATICTLHRRPSTAVVGRLWSTSWPYNRHGPVAAQR